MTTLKKAVEKFHREEIVGYDIIATENSSLFLDAGSFSPFYLPDSKKELCDLIDLGFDWIYSHVIFLRMKNRSQI